MREEYGAPLTEFECTTGQRYKEFELKVIDRVLNRLL
jgi:hypothetical protein